MPARIEQRPYGLDETYYTLYADCPDCGFHWGWRDDDRKTTNYADLKAEVGEHNREVHGRG